jgi:hypothetical protein
MNVTRFNTLDLDLETESSQTGPWNENSNYRQVLGAMAGGGSSILARGRLDSARKGWRRHE